MSINFPNNNVKDGDVYFPPESPEVIYVYNAARGIWLGGDAEFGNHPAVGAFSGQPGFDAVRGTTGPVGSAGYTGSLVGYTGSAILKGTIRLSGYTGSRGPVGVDSTDSGAPGKSTLSVSAPTRTVTASALNFVGDVTVTREDNNTAKITIGYISSSSSTVRKVATFGPISLASSGTIVWNPNIAAKTYALYSIETSVGAWVRVYSSTASADADQTRTIFQDPAPNSGIIAESITTGVVATKVLFTPAVLGANNDPTPLDLMYVRITNNSGGTQTAFTATITYFPMSL
jgi:hypothetical protein